MHRRLIILKAVVVVLLALVSFPRASSAQGQGNGSTDSWSLSASVQGDRHVAPAGASGGVVVFYVTNTGTARNRVLLSCRGAEGVTCDSLDVKRLNLKPGMTKQVVATITVGATSGTVTLHAEGAYGSSAVAESPITVVAQAGGGGATTQALPCEEECGGGGPTYGVQVGNPAGVTKPANSGPHTAYFSIYNSGSTSNSYTFLCSTLGGVTCGTVTPTSMALASLDDNEVAVTYNVGSSNGTLRLKAIGFQATDIGSMAVTASNAPPLVSLSPHNSSYNHVAKCIANCFAATWEHSTPAYLSFGQERSLTLVYNSSTVDPTPVVLLDVVSSPGFAPTTYSLQAKLVSSGVFLTLLNGSNTVFYTASGTTVNRVAIAFDARLNGLGNGWHDIDVIVTASYSTGSPASTTVTTRVPVVDRTDSPFGAGVTIAGVQRFHYLLGSSLAVVESDGSIAYYKDDGAGGFLTPGGSTLSLENRFPIVPLFKTRRFALDSSYVEFNLTGRMTNVVDRFGNTTILGWADSVLLYIEDPTGKRLTLNYPAGKLASVTDPGSPSRVTNFTIDANNRLTRITDPDGEYTQFDYWGTGGQLKTVTTRAGRTAEYAYHPQLNRLHVLQGSAFTDYTGTSVQPAVTLTPQEIVVWQLTITGTTSSNPKAAIAALGVTATIQDPLNRTTTYTLSSSGAPTKIVDAVGRTLYITRDSMARPTYIAKPSAYTVSTVYGNGSEPELNFSPYLVKRVIDSDGLALDYTYTSLNDVATLTRDSIRYDFLYHNDLSGRTGALREIYVGNQATWPTIGAEAILLSSFEVDQYGRDTTITDGLGHTTRLTYDANTGNPVAVVDPVGVDTRVHRDAYGRVDSLFAPGPWRGTLKAIWTTRYGVLNEVLGRTSPLGDSIYAQYDADLNIDAIVNEKGESYHVTRDELGRPKVLHDLAISATGDTAKYDAAGQVRTVVRRGGEVISYEYDGVGRMVAIAALNADTVRFRHAPNDRWFVATAGAAYDSLTYDATEKLTSWVQVLDGDSYEWNYSYDNLSRLTGRSLTKNGVPSLTVGPMSWTYNEEGLIDEIEGAGVHVWHTYNDDLLLERREFSTVAGGPLWFASRDLDSTHTRGRDWFNLQALDTELGLNYLYHDDARIEYKTGTTFEDSRFFYDDAGQLERECVPSAVCVGGGDTFEYDPAGNRFDPEDNPVVAPGNRLIAFGGWTFVYDLNGQLISKSGAGGSWSYEWDGLGRLTEVRSGSDTTRYVYDGFGRRVAKTGTIAEQYYLYDGSQIILDLNGNGTVQNEYAWYPGTDHLLGINSAAWGGGVAITDAANDATVRAIVDGSAGVVKKFSYDPWGHPTTADTGVVVRFRFHGRELDPESGLYYMRARYYDPDVGRFISEDPIGVGGGLNLYVYAGNDPVNGWDPYGLCPPCAPPPGGPGGLPGGAPGNPPPGRPGGFTPTIAYTTPPQGESGFGPVPGTAAWYADRIVRGIGNRFFNELGGTLAACAESIACNVVLLVGGPVGGAASRIGNGLARASTAVGEQSIMIGSATEARIAGRLWTLGGGPMRSGRGVGSIIGRISSDATRTYRAPVLKTSGPNAGHIAANLGRWIGAGIDRAQIGNVHLVIP